MVFPKNIQKAIVNLSRLPSLGPRSAERIVLNLIKKPAVEIDELADAIKDLSQSKICQRCFNLAEKDLCPICLDKNRDQKTICVVESPLDLMAIESKHIFNGMYHILEGTVKVGRRDNTHKLKIKELKARIPKEHIKEVIIATNPTTDGDMTAVLVKEALARFPKLKITRLSRGLTTGADLEYADPESIRGSFKGRIVF